MTPNLADPRTRFSLLSSRLRAAFTAIASLMLTFLSYLRREPIPVLKADHYVRFLRSSAQRGGSNLVFSQRIPQAEFHRRLQRTDYWQWVQAADYHYFISRVLFLHMIREYSLFAGHQCVENYLKAYLRYRRRSPPMKHDLPSLLEDCRAVAPARHLFLFSDQAKVVAERYNPFYELARYPVHTIAPRGGGYVVFFPTDLAVLDYFVYRMRQLLPAAGRSWDILVDGSYHLYECQRQYPEFYRFLTAGNLNFGGSLSP